MCVCGGGESREEGWGQTVPVVYSPFRSEYICVCVWGGGCVGLCKKSQNYEDEIKIND